MKNLHILPTEKPSKLLLSGFGTLFLTPPMEFKSSDKYQNIYITSNEEIKDGDWFYDTQFSSLKAQKARWDTKDRHQSKIILTTDQELIADGVQAIDDEFLEWFVKNPSCERVEIINRYSDFTRTKFLDYKIIIPQEETKQEAQGYICPQTKKQCDDECCVSAEDCHIEQSIGVISDCEPDEEPCDNCDYCNNDICCCIIRTQETLEEAAEKTLQDEINYWYEKTGSLTSEDIVRRAYSLGITAGAKWQAERMYSDEEAIRLLIKFNQEIREVEDVRNWFEQFKKK
jgi:hypothetical protein